MAEDNDAPGRRQSARALVQQALRAEREGDQDRADALMAEAERIDPDETIEALQEYVADRPRPRGA